MVVRILLKAVQTFWTPSDGDDKIGTVKQVEPPRPGELLISTCPYGAGIFDQSVIVLLDCEAGALGVIINLPSELLIDQVLPEWGRLTSPPHVVFAGGPVSPNGAICVARLANPDEDPPGFHKAFGDVGLVHLDTPVELAEGAYSDLRIYVGYAGWDIGQLEDELARGMWLRTSASVAQIFGVDQRSLWRRLLRKQGGDAALLATWSATPEQN